MSPFVRVKEDSVFLSSVLQVTCRRQDCIFQWPHQGPVTVQIFKSTFIASGTSLTAPGSNRTRRVTSVPIASVFLNLSITRNMIILENVDSFFYLCENENRKRKKSICLINKQSNYEIMHIEGPICCQKGIQEQLVLIQCLCINHQYFSPPLDSWLKYTVWDSTETSVQNSTWQKLSLL